MLADGYSKDLIHACHNRTVVIDSHLGERENKQINVVEAHGLRNIHLYEGEHWMDVREAVGDQPPQRVGAARRRAADEVTDVLRRVRLRARCRGEPAR